MATTSAGAKQKAALHFAASGGDAQEVLRLLGEGANVNEGDYDKRTPLHAAAANGHLAVLEILCNNGADCSLTDRWERTPLVDAMTGNHVDAVSFLSKRTTVNKAGRTGIMMKQVSFNHIDPRTPLAQLLFACADGDVLTVRQVLDGGEVEVNDSDDDRRTPMHVAASEGRLAVLKTLSNRNANVNAKDRMGNRPLNDAQRGGFKDCIDFLVSQGAVAAGATKPVSSPGGSPSGSEEKLITLKQMSSEALTELHERGVREFWSWSASDIVMEKTSFAKGAGGEVFKCRFRNMDCVAKTLGKLQSKQNLTDLSNEISLMSSIRHPHIVTFFGACFQTPEPVMLLEYCANGNLETRIIRAYTQDTSRRIKMTESQKVKYAHQMALAITFLHRFHVPIIHRDLKPGNVLLTANDEIKITDFGLAKFLPKEAVPSPTSTAKSESPRESNGEAYKMTGQTGSYRFMAPEVYENKPYDRSVDVYAYSMILYWLYSGIRPFSDCRDGEDAVKLACKGTRPDLKTIKEVQVIDICEAGWSALPENRPTFSEVADILDSCKLNGFDRGRSKSKTGHLRALSSMSAQNKAERRGSEVESKSMEDEKTVHTSKPIEKRKSMFAALFSS